MGYAAAITALLAFLGWCVRRWIDQRIKMSVKHEYDHRLENIKAELKTQGDLQLASLQSEVARQADKLKIAAASFSDVQKATISRKIDAVDLLWQAVLSARKKFPAIITLTDALSEEEIRKLIYGKYREEVLGVRFELITEFFGTVETVRPFLGEVVWALFATYHGLLGRIIFGFTEGKKDDSKLVWYKDEVIRRLIPVVFGAEKLAEFDKLKEGRLRWLNHQFEIKLIPGIERLLSGQSSGSAALLHAEEMESVMSQVTPPLLTPIRESSEQL
ncbi:hypothetical protein SAMN05216237_5006 [Pseudomonas yamanorum]|nr:hypothetical protein SAMN05216237_5006 [Pseudomonas yamanorum]